MPLVARKTSNLFPTPLLRFSVIKAPDLNALLLEEIAERRRSEPSVTRSNRVGWHSQSDLFERPEPGHRWLAREIGEALDIASRAYFEADELAKAELQCDGWVNVNPKGAYNSPHEHPGAFWSGCYYVNAIKGSGSSGKIEFLAPFTPLETGQLIHGSLTARNYEFRPSAGTILVFPANLKHWVHPNSEDEDRITIAFNGTFRTKKRRGTSINVGGARRED